MFHSGTGEQQQKQAETRKSVQAGNVVSTVPKASLISQESTHGQALTGKQEHYLKRELISAQVSFEITELNSPTALQRFGAPFKSDFGEISPLDSELPILRYIFVHHVREFPFLDKAKEKEFWQDKLQVFLQSFANKHISSSEDRLEETKRRKLAIKCQKLVELMMVSGIPTASGYEERIRFSELEVVDAGAIDHGVLQSLPEGHYTNGWDVNVSGVRTISVKRNIRYHKHAEFILRVKRKNELHFFIGRRYGDFHRLLKRLHTELPGKILPPLPKKNKQSSTASNLLSGITGRGGDDDDVSSISSVSTVGIPAVTSSMNTLSVRDHNRNRSSISYGRSSPRASVEGRPLTPGQDDVRSHTLKARHAKKKLTRPQNVVLWRENQRISLRAFLRTLLANPQIAGTRAMQEFLTYEPMTPTDADVEDIAKRKAMDEQRVEEQKQFYEIARRRAADLDVYMEQFRRDVVESNGLTNLFKEIKDKATIQDLSIQYQKFAEWLRIEVAATIYHLFLAEDNSPDLFAQMKRIHSMIPYTMIKNAIRIANPAAVMSTILDIFLAQPFGARSLMQRIFAFTLNDGIKAFQKSIDALNGKIDDVVLSEKLKKFSDAPEDIKNRIRHESVTDSVDLIVAILRSEDITPPLNSKQIGRVFNAYVAWNSAVENVDEEMKQGVQLFSYMKQLLKLYTRQRDKAMMLSMIEEPVTLHLLKDLFTIFYEPLVRVYKSANVYNSVTDFAVFIDDMITVVEKCREQDFSADPNQTVQAFIDLCQRHEHNFYKFVHEVHTHDNGLFTQLMGWIEGILEFLRQGPKAGKLDINALFTGAVSVNQIDRAIAIKEIDSLIAWQEARKKWHSDKTRQKMAAEGGGNAQGEGMLPGGIAFSSRDFGIEEMDLQDLEYADDEEGSSDEESADDELDPIVAERKRRARKQDHLRRSAGEPVKPEVVEVRKLRESFLSMLRMVLAE
ncbi:PX domain protein [Diplocarpon rosae]|nr:PX domain protein [Diplocarpon rosae]